MCTYFRHDWKIRVVHAVTTRGKWVCSEVIVEIVILAMIAAFLGLRLYSVLGRRAEHEEEPIPTRFDQPDAGAPSHRTAAPAQPVPAPFRPREFAGLPPAIEQGLHAISGADRRFDLSSFIAGAKSAYQMVLEAFWHGEKDTLRQLCDKAVYESFSSAIDAREEAGETLDNRLVRIEEAVVHSATLEGKTARIAVAFRADIAAVTRDKKGNVIAGSLDDAVESRDIWTFSRNVNSTGPDWLLDETDEG